ncbi:MAG: hypothetical protein NWF06_11240, partial [Candidatus Bathyarchaeota archaeon]|nr:hypothetical protein [Candidatus Bathyarchaeum sp.]
VDHLLTLQNDTTGCFNWTATDAGWDPVMCTIHAIIALSGKTYPVTATVTTTYVGDFNENGGLEDTGANNDKSMLEDAIDAWDGGAGPYDATYDLDNDSELDGDDVDIWEAMEEDYSSS